MPEESPLERKISITTIEVPPVYRNYGIRSFNIGKPSNVYIPLGEGRPRGKLGFSPKTTMWGAPPPPSESSDLMAFLAAQEEALRSFETYGDQYGGSDSPLYVPSLIKANPLSSSRLALPLSDSSESEGSEHEETEDEDEWVSDLEDEDLVGLF